jgi:hypothetical protein
VAAEERINMQKKKLNEANSYTYDYDGKIVSVSNKKR